ADGREIRSGRGRRSTGPLTSFNHGWKDNAPGGCCEEPAQAAAASNGRSASPDVPSGGERNCTELATTSTALRRLPSASSQELERRRPSTPTRLPLERSASRPPPAGSRPRRARSRPSCPGRG